MGNIKLSDPKEKLAAEAKRELRKIADDFNRTVREYRRKGVEFTAFIVNSEIVVRYIQ